MIAANQSLSGWHSETEGQIRLSLRSSIFLFRAFLYDTVSEIQMSSFLPSPQEIVGCFGFFFFFFPASISKSARCF